MPFRLEIFIRQGTFTSFEVRLPDIRVRQGSESFPKKSQSGIVVFCTTPQGEVAAAQGTGLQ